MIFMTKPGSWGLKYVKTNNSMNITKFSFKIDYFLFLSIFRQTFKILNFLSFLDQKAHLGTWQDSQLLLSHQKWIIYKLYNSVSKTVQYSNETWYAWKWNPKLGAWNLEIIIYREHVRLQFNIDPSNLVALQTNQTEVGIIKSEANHS